MRHPAWAAQAKPIKNFIIPLSPRQFISDDITYRFLMAYSESSASRSESRGWRLYDLWTGKYPEIPTACVFCIGWQVERKRAAFSSGQFIMKSWYQSSNFLCHKTRSSYLCLCAWWFSFIFFCIILYILFLPNFINLFGRFTKWLKPYRIQWIHQMLLKINTRSWCWSWRDSKGNSGPSADVLPDAFKML